MLNLRKKVPITGNTRGSSRILQLRSHCARSSGLFDKYSPSRCSESGYIVRIFQTRKRAPPRPSRDWQKRGDPGLTSLTKKRLIPIKGSEKNRTSEPTVISKHLFMIWFRRTSNWRLSALGGWPERCGAIPPGSGCPGPGLTNGLLSAILNRCDGIMHDS